MQKVAQIGIKFDIKKEINKFTLSLPDTTQVLSCKRVPVSDKNFLQICYSYFVKNLEDENLKWKNFDFFIVSTAVENFDSTGITFIQKIKVNTLEFNVFYKF